MSGAIRVVDRPGATATPPAAEATGGAVVLELDSATVTTEPVESWWSRADRRLSPSYDDDGPRVVLGLAWFAAVVAALAAGWPGITVLYGAVAALSALQLAVCWRRRGVAARRAVAVVAAPALVAAGVLGAPTLGLAVLGLVAVAVGVPAVQALRQGELAFAPLATTAGWTVQCALVPGLAGAALAGLGHQRLGAAVAVVLVAAAYDCGAYLVGAGSNRAWEAPLAGALGAGIVVLFLGSMAVAPLALPGAWGYAALAAVLCPAGQYAASACLPDARDRASALRRLDSLLVLGPVWAMITFGVLG